MAQNVRLFPLVICAVLAVTAEAADWKTDLRESLASKYELTQTGGDRVRITKPGTILVIRKDNINGDVASALLFTNNKVEPDGNVKQGGGAGNGRVFKTGEKVYLYNISVEADSVKLEIISAETFEVTLRGSTRQTRYKAALDFQFDKGTLAGADVEAVRKRINAVVAPEDVVSAANTKSIDLGMSRSDVETALGKPDTVINLGAKVTYVYKTMKVIFQDGKVADVQ